MDFHKLIFKTDDEHNYEHLYRTSIKRKMYNYTTTTSALARGGEVAVDVGFSKSGKRVEWISGGMAGGKKERGFLLFLWQPLQKSERRLSHFVGTVAAQKRSRLSIPIPSLQTSLPMEGQHSQLISQ